MKIQENENARILALFHQIRERQERDNEHTNYKDAPALHEMADLIRPYIGKPEQEDLADIAAVCLFLGNRYREMMRGVYAAEFFTAAFCAAVKPWLDSAHATASVLVRRCVRACVRACI